MPWSQRLTNLCDVLADLYPFREDALRIVVEVGLRPAQIRFDTSSVNTWFSVLTNALQNDSVNAVIAVARKDHPKQEFLRLADCGELSAVKGPDINRDVEWKGSVDGDTLERIIGRQSSFLPVCFLQVGAARARSVARVLRDDGDTGTGFLVDGDLLITNHHVLASAVEAAKAIAQFNYELTPTGLDAPREDLALAPADGFATSKEHDWTAVRVTGTPTVRWGSYELTPLECRIGDRVSIIQHPGGGPKHIALSHNSVVYVNSERVQYLTDTLPGSSGAPVFDESWRVVAIHHSGGFLREPGSKQRYYRNEGVHVNVIVAGLAKAGLQK
jgi:V8-like Glu-specific endopeptidase